MDDESGALNENATQPLDELTGLQEVAQLVSDVENLQAVFDLIVEKTAHLTGADVTVLSLLSSDQQTLSDVAAFGVAAKAQQSRERSSHKGLSAQVIHGGKSLLVNDLISNGRVTSSETLEVEAGAAMIAPLAVNSQVVGCLSAFNRRPSRPFPRHKFDLLNKIAIQAAQTIENARLHTESVKRLRALSTLEEMSKVLISGRARDEILKLIIEQVAHLLEADRATIDLVNPDRETRTRAAGFGIDTDIRQGQKYSLQEGILGRVIATAEPLLVNDVSIYPLASSSGNRAARHGVFAPLRTEDQIIGAIEVNRSVDKPPFTKDDLHLLTLFADQAAAAIENAGLHDELNQRVRELELVQELGSALVRELNLERARELIVEKAVQLTGAETSALSIPNEGADTRTFVAAWGLDAETIKGRTASATEGLHGIVYQTGSPILSNDIQTDALASGVGRQLGNRSVAIAPLKSHDRFIGWLTIWSRHEAGPFNANHLRTLSIFANLAAIALQNARLYGALERAAAIDPLTGLWNRGTLEERLHAELARAVRFNFPLTVVLVDVDNLKIVNDTYGHVAGDAALIHIAHAMMAACRVTDVVGRYGGDEFGILLAGTSEKDATVVAQRILDWLCEHPIEFGNRQVHLSVSIGMASYPTHHHEIVTLLSLADNAMYAAKAQGGARVRICDGSE